MDYYKKETLEAFYRVNKQLFEQEQPPLQAARMEINMSFSPFSLSPAFIHRQAPSCRFPNWN
jgi:hypothetical protein